MSGSGARVLVDAKTKVRLDANETVSLLDLVKSGDVDKLIKAYNANLTLAGGKSAEKLENIRGALIAVYDRILKGEDNFYDALTGKAIDTDKIATLSFGAKTKLSLLLALARRAGFGDRRRQSTRPTVRAGCSGPRIAMAGPLARQWVVR